VNKNLISNEVLSDRLRWRYAVKRFDSAKKITEAEWSALEESLVLSPSSYGLQPWKFYVVTNETVKTELLPHSYNQPQTVECSHLVVIAAKKDTCPEDIEKYLGYLMEVRGTPAEELEILKGAMLGAQKQATDSGFINEWAARQCFISLGFLLTAAAMMGIDTCPMEGFIPQEYDKVLEIEKDGYFSVVVCAVGYRDREKDWLSKLGKVRYKNEDIVKRI